MLVGQPQHHRRTQQQQDRRDERPVEHRVDVVVEGAHRVGEAVDQRTFPRCHRNRLGDLDAAFHQLVGRTDHRRPVTRMHGDVSARAGDHLARLVGGIGADDGNRREVAVHLPQRPLLGRGCTGHHEVDTGDRDGVSGQLQQRLHHRGGGQVRDVEDGAGSVVGGHRLAQYRVDQSRHHPDPGIGLPGQQRHLQVHRVVVGHADDCVGHRDPGRLQAVRGLQRHHAELGIVELVDDPYRERIVPADDDVAVHGETLLRNPSR